MRSHIFIYILAAFLVSACRQQVPVNKIINQQASLPASFGLGNMGVIASFINKKQHTMSTLYGNLVSVQRARAGEAVQPHEQLLLVTWEQKADENWFGANIPGQVQSVEQVITGAQPTDVTYQRYEGNPLSPGQDTTAKTSRINSIFGLQASIMP